MPDLPHLRYKVGHFQKFRRRRPACEDNLHVDGPLPDRTRDRLGIDKTVINSDVHLIQDDKIIITRCQALFSEFKPPLRFLDIYGLQLSPEDVFRSAGPLMTDSRQQCKTRDLAVEIPPLHELDEGDLSSVTGNPQRQPQCSSGFALSVARIDLYKARIEDTLRDIFPCHCPFLLSNPPFIVIQPDAQKTSLWVILDEWGKSPTGGFYLKIKVNPEDFQVEEVLSTPLAQTMKPHRVYRLKKRNWNTVDALAEIARTKKIPLKDLHWCGRKDRSALTTQYFSTTSLVDMSFKSTNVSTEFAGFSNSELGPSSISGNLFRIALRDLTPGEISTTRKRIGFLEEFGFANYFDDQRFGDVESGGFLGEMLIKRHFKAAVKRIFTSCHPEAPGETRKRKKALADRWGRWSDVAPLCPEPQLKAMLEAMMNGEGPIGALRKVPREEMGQYFSSYQSFIWNLVLAEVLKKRECRLFAIPCRMGPLPQYDELSPDNLAFLSELQIPTAAADMPPMPEETGAILSRILFQRGVRLSKFRLPEIPQAYFASFERPAIVIPGEVRCEEGEDRLFPGRQLLSLEFFLPRGSFATMLIKSISGNPE